MKRSISYYIQFAADQDGAFEPGNKETAGKQLTVTDDISVR